VHHHVTPATSDRPAHWDLMLEERTSDAFDPEARTLATWALEEQPLAGRTIKARQLENHRGWYLDHDGPLSGGRGVVSRQMGGEFEWLVNGSELKQVRLIRAAGDWILRITRISGREFAVQISESGSRS
jgi:hypothetical protein